MTRPDHLLATTLAFLAAMALLACPADAAPRPDAATLASHWGPEYSTPGVRLALVEIARHVARPGEAVPYPDWVGKTVVRYRLKATGLLPGAKYDLWVRPSFHQPVRTRYVTRVDAAGNVTTESGTKVNFTIGDYHKGEPYSVGLISPDGAVKAIALAYPFPLRAVDGPCRLTLEMLAVNGTMFAAFGHGFPPGGRVETVSRANGDVIRSKKSVGRNGAISSLLAPPAIGDDDHASYAIHAKGCSVKVNYGLGPAALAPQ